MSEPDKPHRNEEKNRANEQPAGVAPESQVSAETGPPTTTFHENPEDQEIVASAVPAQLGRYVVQGLVGRGGFGEVYKGWDPQLRRTVAIKVPRSGLLRSAQEIEDFLDEARRAAQLEHPRIVAVYDAGQSGEQCYIVSHYVEGPTLAQYLKTAHLTAPEAARLLATLADAVHFAHRHGWVHRDIKPSNILLDREGKPHLTDFGIAAKLEDLRRARPSGAGTLRYMAPEVVRQLVGHAAAEPAPTLPRPDHRADIYSLGVVLYQLLTRRLPFEAESTEAIADLILHSEMIPPRLIDEKIPPRLEEVCSKATAKEPAARFRTAADFRDDLQAALAESPGVPGVKAQTTYEVPTVRLPGGMNWRHILVGAGILGVFLAVLGYSLFPKRTTELAASKPPQPTASPPRSIEVSSERAQLTPSAQTVDVIREIRELLREQDSRRFNVHAGLPESAPPSPDTADTTPIRTPTKAKDTSEPKDKSAVDLPRPFDSLETEIAAARAKGDEDKEFNLLLRATNELIDAGYFAEAKGAAERMVEVAGKDPGRVPFAYGQLGLAQYRLGHAEKAIASYEESLKVYRSLYAKMQKYPETEEVKGYLSHLARLIGISLMRIGNANKFLERYKNAEVAYLEAKELLERHERKSELMTLLSNLGSLQSNRGEHAEGIATFQRSLALARELNDRAEEAEILINLANAQARAADNAEALKSYKAAYELMSPAASYEARTGVLTNWITTLVDENKLDEARELLTQLRRIARPDDEHSNRILKLLDPVLSAEAADKPKRRP